LAAKGSHWQPQTTTSSQEQFLAAIHNQGQPLAVMVGHIQNWQSRLDTFSIGQSSAAIYSQGQSLAAIHRDKKANLN
jgi:hypothetical protein